MFPLPDTLLWVTSCYSMQTHDLASYDVGVIAWQRWASLWAEPGFWWLGNGSWYSVWQTEQAPVRCEVGPCSDSLEDDADCEGSQLSCSHWGKLRPCRSISQHGLIQTKTASVSGMINLITRCFQSVVRCRMFLLAFPAFSYLLKRALQLNSKCSKYQTWCLQESDEGRLAGLERGDSSQQALYSTAGRCWTCELMIEHLAFEEPNLLPSEWHYLAVFQGNGLTVSFALSVQVADTCSSLDRLLIPLLWGRREGFTTSPMCWRGSILSRRSQKTAFSGSKPCQFCISLHA